MARKLLLINLVLALAVAGLGMQLVWSWQEFEQQQNIPRLLANLDSPQNSSVQPLDQDYGQQPGFADFQLIAEKNLFAPERQPPQEDSEALAEETAPPLNPEPTLHGTLLIGDRQYATITKYEGRGRRSQPSKVKVTLGDDVQGYTVSEISRDAIVLKWNDTEVVIEKDLGERPEAPVRRIARGGGINIVRIGAPVTAVETTTASASDEQQESGLTVSRTGLAQAQSGGVADRARSQGQLGGANARGGASNRLRGSQTQNLNRQRQNQPPSGGVVPNSSNSRPTRRPPN